MRQGEAKGHGSRIAEDDGRNTDLIKGDGSETDSVSNSKRTDEMAMPASELGAMREVTLQCYSLSVNATFTTTVSTCMTIVVMSLYHYLQSWKQRQWQY